MDERKLIHLGIAAVLAITIITVVGSKGALDTALAGMATADGQMYAGNYGLYRPGFRYGIAERPGELTYQQRVDKLAVGGSATQRRLSKGGSTRYGGNAPGGLIRSDSGVNIPETVEAYGYNPYIDRTHRYSGYYVVNEFA